MKFIDHILRAPIVETATQNLWNKQILLAHPPASFVVDNVSREMIVDQTVINRNGAGMGIAETIEVTFSAMGDELLWKNGKPTMAAAVPPYESCFFEYQPHWNTDRSFEGVWFLSGPSVEAAHLADAQEALGHEAQHVILANVFHRYRSLDGLNMPINDCQGSAILVFDNYWNLVRLAPDPAMPNRKEILVGLASLMLMGLKLASPILPPMTRPERRRAQRDTAKGHTAEVRFWTLKLNLPEREKGVNGSGHGGGWHNAWHLVRGHLRRYKSGKVVHIAQHSRGDARKGLVLKDYELQLGSAAAPTKAPPSLLNDGSPQMVEVRA